MHFARSVCLCLAAGVACLATINMRDENVPPNDVSFRLEGGSNPLILVPVYVDGKGPFQFILDTGAYHCLLSSELSAAIGVRREAQRQATGAGGSMKISSANLSSMSVGSARQENVEVAVTEELSKFADAVRGRVDGLLGFNFLKDFRLTIDYQRNVLDLVRTSPGARIDTGTQPAASIPFSLASPIAPLILLPVFVNGRGPFQFALDTGASRTTLSFKLARQLGVVAVGNRSATAGGGQMKMFSATVNMFTL